MSQNTNMGRDFWVMFLPNDGGTHQLPNDSCTLLAVGPDEAEIMVVSNNDSATFHLAAATRAIYLCGSNDEVRGKAYHVTSTTPIALYARNAIFSSHDVAMVIPTACLGTEYIAQSSTASHEGSEMLGFVATEDSTVITVDFHTWLGYRHVPDDLEVPDDGQLHIPLQRGETYILGTQQPLNQDTYTWGWFSGKTVTSNGRPFALFQGNSAAHVPVSDNYSGNHLYEQAVPVSQWGHTYMMGGIAEQQRYYGMLISADDSNEEHYPGDTGILTRTYLRGEISLYQAPGYDNYGTALVNANTTYFTGRTGHYLLMGSYGVNGFCGGPSSVTVPSMEHGVGEAWFTAEQFDDYQKNHLTILCDTLTAATLRLDGQLLSLHSAWHPNRGWNSLLYQPYSTTVSNGPHHLEVDSGTFVAFLYGLREGYSDSYANPIGMALESYPRDTTAYLATVCLGSPYQHGPFHFEAGTLTEAGTFDLETKVFDPDTVHHYTLTLTVLPTYTTTLRDSLDEGDTLHIADSVITQPGTYTFHFTAANGCDSTVTLHLASCMPAPYVSLSRPYIDFDHPVVTFTDCTEGSVLSQWLFGDGSVYTGTPLRRQFHHPPPDSLEVTLHTCNQRGCCSDTTFVIGTRTLNVWFPNVFTPDAGTNNRFGVVTTVETTDFELIIYNRRGEVLFTASDPAATWDGTYNGAPLPTGTYVYFWYMKDAHDFRQNGTGTVTLLR